VSAREEESEAQQAFCYVKSSISFLRVGRFVDANEEKNECLLCDRVGFTTPLFETPYKIGRGEREDKVLNHLTTIIVDDIIHSVIE